MNEEMINGLIGTLNLGVIISDAKGDDLVHIPQEDVLEIIMCLNDLKNYIQEG